MREDGTVSPASGRRPGPGMARRARIGAVAVLGVSLGAAAGCAYYVAPAPYYYPAAVPVDPAVASVGAGAAAGAAAGALIGSTSGEAGAGAAIGAGLGALGGYLAERERRQRWEDRQRGAHGDAGWHGPPDAARW